MIVQSVVVSVLGGLVVDGPVLLPAAVGADNNVVVLMVQTATDVSGKTVPGVDVDDDDVLGHIRC